MEMFAYNKAWKVGKFMACGYPAIGLLGIAVRPGHACTIAVFVSSSNLACCKETCKRVTPR